MADERPDDAVILRCGANATRLRDGSVLLRIHDCPELAARVEQPSTALTIELSARPRTLDDIHRESGTREMTPEEFDEHFGHLPITPND